MPAPLYYEMPPVAKRRQPFASPAGWFLLSAICAVVQFWGWFATNGRLNGWGDLVFIALLTFGTVLGLIEGARGIRRRRHENSKS